MNASSEKKFSLASMAKYDVKCMEQATMPAKLIGDTMVNLIQTHDKSSLRLSLFNSFRFLFVILLKMSTKHYR